MGDRGDRARTGAAAQGLPHAPLPDPHVELVGGAGRDAHELDVGAAREAVVALEVRTVLGDAGGRGVVDEQHEVRVAHPRGVALVAGAVVVGGDAERGVDRDRDPRRVEGDRPHVDGRRDDRRRCTRSRVSSTWRRPPPVSTTSVPSAPRPVACRDPRQGAHAVAAHLGDAAVGVEEEHLGVGAVGAGPHDDEAVGPDAPVAVAERGRLRRRAMSGTAVVVAQPRPHEEVVPGGVQLGEADRGHALQLASRRGEDRGTDSPWPRTTGCADPGGTTCVGAGRTCGCGPRRRRGRRRATAPHRSGARAPPGSRSPAGRCAKAAGPGEGPRPRRPGRRSRIAANRCSIRVAEHGARQPHPGHAHREHRGRRTPGCPAPNDENGRPVMRITSSARAMRRTLPGSIPAAATGSRRASSS